MFVRVRETKYSRHVDSGVVGGGDAAGLDYSMDCCENVWRLGSWAMGDGLAESWWRLRWITGDVGTQMFFFLQIFPRYSYRGDERHK